MSDLRAALGYLVRHVEDTDPGGHENCKPEDPCPVAVARVALATPTAPREPLDVERLARAILTTLEDAYAVTAETAAAVAAEYARLSPDRGTPE